MAELREDIISESENINNSLFKTHEKKILGDFKSILNFGSLLSVPQILYLVAIFFKYLFESYYSYKAEKFYGVPRHYFYSNQLANANMILIFLVIYVIMLLLPYILYNFLIIKYLD